MICMTSFSFTAFADSESAADEILQTEAEKYELPEITYVKQKTYSDYYSEISDKVRRSSSYSVLSITSIWNAQGLNRSAYSLRAANSFF